MHLPVAPKCNISCNYCSRRYDCLHESRPGVTSEVLGPSEAQGKFLAVREKIENLSVVGIAGPGDALANWEEVSQTVKLVKETDPEVLFCLSTNGLLLPDYAAEVLALGIKHVTVTLNTLNPETGARIYKHVNYKGQHYTGITGAEILLKNQLAGIEYLTKHGALVKINIVMIKGINETEIPDIVKKASELGAFMTNIMPLIPAQGSEFENYPQTTAKELNTMRQSCQPHLRQMYHCRQCRADAIGLLGEDRSIEFSGAACKTSGAACKTSDNAEIPPKHKRLFRIAVASKTGRLVDQHFGHASEFKIYQGDGETFQLVERRQIEQYCLGVDECGDSGDRKDAVIGAIRDCDAVITLRIGYHASQRLQKSGILSIEHYDTIENGLNHAVQQLLTKEAV
jgi:nitrogen fixation protein NifB